MPKGPITKKKLSITIDDVLAKSLEKQCEKRTMKLSNYIQKLIKLGMKHEKK